MATDDAIELTLVTMTFRTDRLAELLDVLAKYVVLSRGQDGCRNIDLAASALVEGRVVIVQKWESPAHQRAHFDSPEMIEMAQTSGPLLTSAPDIDLLEPVSVHDIN